MSVTCKKSRLLRAANCLFRFYRSKSSQSKSSKKSTWEPVVGLEIHAQILSKSKLFSGASTDFSSAVNSSVALFDAAIPGTLPVLNRRCVEAGVLTALALNCKVNRVSMFDRKHYFYSDLPAGYQITQQRAPLASGGELEFHVSAPGAKKWYVKRARLVQLQLEQDSGRSLHDQDENKSLVDLNRAGIPLMELVFHPDLTDGEEAAALVKELILILQRLGTCSCKMEEGALRVDANISLHKPDTPLGVRTEIKNIGSVRGVANAIAYEINRQKQILDSGGVITNETRNWDAIQKVTVTMREKEDRHDYRFMPEPNLPPLMLKISENEDKTDPDLIDVPALHKTLPELPAETRSKLIRDFDLTPEMAIMIVSENKLLEYFLGVMSDTNIKINAMLLGKIMVNELLTLLHKNKIEIDYSPISTEHLREVLELLQNETISNNIAKNILQKLLESDKLTPKEIVQEQNWAQITDEKELLRICKDVLDKNEKLVTLYKKGKTKVLFAMLGEVAKTTNNRAKMSRVTEIMQELLK